MAEPKEDNPTLVICAEQTGSGDNPSSDEKPSEKVLVAEAQVGFADEKELGPWAALKVYRPAVMWAFVMATCVIMEGYDTALLGSFFAYRM
jgi:SP family general alpha glucoside:H+ symporter-like MFS transporter